MSVTKIIKTPRYRSNVPGFDILAGADIEPSAVPDSIIAHQEYISVQIFADGSNSQHAELKHDVVALFFVQPGIEEFLCGRYDGILYAGIPCDFTVDLLLLVDQPFEPDIPGINLEVWSTQDDEPLCTLSILSCKQTLLN